MITVLPASDEGTMPARDRSRIQSIVLPVSVGLQILQTPRNNRHHFTQFWNSALTKAAYDAPRCLLFDGGQEFRGSPVRKAGHFNGIPDAAAAW